MQRADVLERAKEAVSDRPSVYGSPEQNFERIARLWNAHVHNTVGPGADVSFTAGDVAIMLGMVKIARLAADPKHADSWVDLAGYAACGGEVTGAGEKRRTAREAIEDAMFGADGLSFAMRPWRTANGLPPEGDLVKRSADGAPRRFHPNENAGQLLETKFGFTVGETVNTKDSQVGCNPGQVVGFTDKYVRVRWHNWPISETGAFYNADTLRHGP
jgi:hypothetical protein